MQEKCYFVKFRLKRKFHLQRRRNVRKSGTAQIYGERGSASLNNGGLGALHPVGSRGKAPGLGVWGGRSPPEADSIFLHKTQF